MKSFLKSAFLEDADDDGNAAAGADGHSRRGALSASEARAYQLVEVFERTAELEEKHQCLSQLQDLIERASPALEVDKDVLDVLGGYLGEAPPAGYEDDVREVRTAAVNVLLKLMPLDEPGKAHMTQFLHEPTPAGALVELLQDTDYRLRVATTRLLTVLLLGRRKEMQKVIVGQPMGVNLVLDLFDDQRDIVQNEFLCLLEALIQDNVVVQKIAAFSGCFEKLLALASQVREQDDVNVLCIAEDCLRLAALLLEDNTHNQEYIGVMETNVVPQVASFLRAPRTSPHQNPQLFESENNLMQFALDVVRNASASVSVGRPSAVQTTQHRLGSAIAALMRLAADAGLPVETRTVCLETVGRAMVGHAANQAAFRELQLDHYTMDAASMPTADTANTRSAFYHCVFMCVHSPNAEERVAAEFAIDCYFADNAKGQAEAANTFFSFGGGQQQQGARAGRGVAELGPALLKALDGIEQDAWSFPAAHSAAQLKLHVPYRRAAWAARLTASLLRGNGQVKELLLVPASATPVYPGPSSADETKQQQQADDEKASVFERVFKALFSCSTPVDMQSNVDPQSPTSVYLQIRERERALTRVALLTLLCEWLQGSGACMKSVFESDGARQLVLSLIDQPPAVMPQALTTVTVDKDNRGKGPHLDEDATALNAVHVRGLATLTVALCLDHAEEGLDNSTLFELITKSIGMDDVRKHLSALMEAPTMEYASMCPHRSAPLMLAVFPGTYCAERIPMPYSARFVELFTQVENRLDKRLLSLLYACAVEGGTRAPPQQPQPQPQPQQSAAPVPDEEMKRENADLKKQLRQLKGKQKALTMAASAARKKAKQANDALEEAKATIAQLESAASAREQQQQQQGVAADNDDGSKNDDDDDKTREREQLLQARLEEVEREYEQLQQTSRERIRALEERLEAEMRRQAADASKDSSGAPETESDDHREDWQSKYDQLLADQEDLLILLASQELEKEALVEALQRRRGGSKAMSPSNVPSPPPSFHNGGGDSTGGGAPGDVSFGGMADVSLNTPMKQQPQQAPRHHDEKPFVVGYESPQQQQQ